MELICDKCGAIAMFVAKRSVEEEIRLHVEGRDEPSRFKTRKRIVYKAHPGHVVKAVPDSSPSPFMV